MNILFIVSTLSRGGPTNQLYYIIKYLNRDKFLPSILTLSPEPQNSMQSAFRDLNIKIDSLGISRYNGFIFSHSRLNKIIRENQPDIIHSIGFRADLLSAYHLKGFKRISTLRNCLFSDYKVKYGVLLGAYMSWKHQRATKQIDCAVGCGYAMADIVLKKYGLKLSVIQNGVDTELFQSRNNEQKSYLRKKLNIDSCERIYLSAGNLHFRKRPDVLIKAFLASKVSRKNMLLVIGNGPLYGTCKRISAASPNVRLIGEIKNISEYLKASDIFISMSSSEGLPNAVLEAMATGLPVYLSDIGPHREILELNKNAGRILPLNDFKNIVSEIDNSVNANYSVMSQAALSIINLSLNAKNMSMQYQQLYQNLYSGTLTV